MTAEKKKEKNAPSSGITKRRFPFRMAPSSSLCLFFFSADDLIRGHRRANQIRRIDIQRVRNVEKYLQRKTVGDPRRFDWADESGQGRTSDHTGIVQKVENGKVYTVEGNSGDSVRQNSYPVGYYEILGYGAPAYWSGGKNEPLA